MYFDRLIPVGRRIYDKFYPVKLFSFRMVVIMKSVDNLLFEIKPLAAAMGVNQYFIKCLIFYISTSGLKLCQSD